MKNRIFSCAVLLSLTLISANAAAAADKKNMGLELSRAAEARNRGWKDYTVSLNMTLKTEKGEETKRSMRMKFLEEPGEGEKQIVVFDRPADVKGTALLSNSYNKKEDEQWLYLPAAKRVKRISSSSRSGSFMGSEFCYEDMGNRSVEKYEYTYLRKEKCGAEECALIERRPREEDSVYSKQLVWMDSEYRIVRVDYFDRKQALYKRLTLKNFQKHIEKIWRPGTLSMENLQNKRSTEINFENFKFRTGLKKSDFNSDSLTSVR